MGPSYSMAPMKESVGSNKRCNDQEKRQVGIFDAKDCEEEPRT